MAIKFEITKWGYCFPTKVLADKGGNHIYNIVLNEDTSNGVIVGKGDYVSFDQYKAATAPTSYEAVLTEQAADGNWYVEVVKPADAVLICEVPESKMGNYDSRFTDVKNFYNPAGKTVRGFALVKGDIYEISEELMDGTPAAGAKVTISGQKHVVAAMPSH